MSSTGRPSSPPLALTSSPDLQRGEHLLADRRHAAGQGHAEADLDRIGGHGVTRPGGQLTVLMAAHFTQAIRIANRGYVIVHGKIFSRAAPRRSSTTTT